MTRCGRGQGRAQVQAGLGWTAGVGGRGRVVRSGGCGAVEGRRRWSLLGQEGLEEVPRPRQGVSDWGPGLQETGLLEGPWEDAG